MVPSPISKYTSEVEAKKHLETLCKEFELCKKYCHLQTSTSSCLQYQLNECKGICCDKESVNDYNNRVKDAIKSIGIGTDSIILKEKGRTENEVGFALILEGIYQGFGFVDIQQSEELENPEDYQFFVEQKKDDKDIQRIIASYIN